ncbi:MAG: addiction module toxin RelE [Firmicutes bacterium]|nr:addiction module toxin RelE [Bacillota bacterium]
MATVVYKRQPEKYLKSVDANTYRKLRCALEGLADGKGDIVKLQGSEYYRLKIEHYRAIFTYDKAQDIITVEELNTRTNIKYRRW